MWLLLKLVCLATIVNQIACVGEIIFALNAGGDSLVDSHGIKYRRDYLTEGVASDYGKSLDIKRVPPSDKILYQTERYSTETFGYNVLMPSDAAGDYVLWLKFSEVWFNAPNQKVFDISLNDEIVIKDLDIFARAGRGIAHDEVVPFKINQKKLIIGDQSISFNGELRVEFIKTTLDNPKVNAIIVMKGTPKDVPELDPYEPPEDLKFNDDDSENDEINSEFDQRDQEDLIRQRMMREAEEEASERERSSRKESSKARVVSDEPTVEDPYANDDSSYLIPVLISIGAFIPLLFCLCKI